MKKGEDISNVEFVEIKEPSQDHPPSEVDTSRVDDVDTNSVDEVSTASTEEVGPSSSSVVVAPTSSVPSSSTSDDTLFSQFTVSVGETRKMSCSSTILLTLGKLLP